MVTLLMERVKMDCRSISTQVSLFVLIVMGVNVLIQFTSFRDDALRITYTSCGNNSIQGDTRNASTIDDTVHGYIISNREERFQFASAALVALNLTPHQHVPWDYRAAEVDAALEAFHGSREYPHSAVDRKMFSNRMAHTQLLREFVDDAAAGMSSWRFFFEDDVAVHPAVASNASAVLVKGMGVAAADGMLHLGICAPAAGGGREVEVAMGVVAARTYGYCSHGYGVTKWRAAAMLGTLDSLKVGLFFDVSLRAYAEHVVRTWAVGVNLASPSPCAWDHFGIVYQDRLRFPSYVNAPEPASDNESIVVPAARSHMKHAP